MNISQLFIPAISIKDRAGFYENISNLLDGGVTLLSALQGFRDRVDHIRLKQEIDNLLFFVEAGDAMSTAMRKLPQTFSDHEISLIEAGEQTGNLKGSFFSLAQDLRDQEELVRKVKGAMTYPLVILVFLALAIVIVMIYVIPQLLTIIDSMGSTEPLPLSTRALISVSGFMQHNIVLLMVAFVGIGLVLRGYLMTDGGRLTADIIRMKLPVIGTVYRNYLVVRIMSTFSLLMNSGVTIIKSLRLTGASAGNLVIASTFSKIADRVAAGQRLADSMREIDPEEIVFSRDILQMIESAEKTSTIPTVTSKIATQYRREVDTSLAILTKFIEPIALLFAGLFVTWFAVAIFSAIMQVVQSASR